MKFEQPLNKAFKDKSIIRIYTEEPDADCYDGLIVCLTDEFLVLAQELDYEFEGFVMIPRDQIDSYCQTPVEAFSQKLMTFTGDIERLTTPEWLVNCTSFDDFFSGILSNNHWTCSAWVCPSCDNIHSDVGMIQSYESGAISVETYDKTGTSTGEMGWSMKKIYSIEFGAPYLLKLGQFLEMNHSTIQ